QEHRLLGCEVQSGSLVRNRVIHVTMSQFVLRRKVMRKRRAVSRGTSPCAGFALEFCNKCAVNRAVMNGSLLDLISRTRDSERFKRRWSDGKVRRSLHGRTRHEAAFFNVIHDRFWKS